MDLKNRVKKTLLLSNSTKEAILSIDWKLPEKLEIFLNDFFEKYGKKEEIILKKLSWSITNIYIKTIQDVEKKERKNNEKYLEKLLKF